MCLEVQLITEYYNKPWEDLLSVLTKLLTFALHNVNFRLNKTLHLCHTQDKTLFVVHLSQIHIYLNRIFLYFPMKTTMQVSELHLRMYFCVWNSMLKFFTLGKILNKDNIQKNENQEIESRFQERGSLHFNKAEAHLPHNKWTSALYGVICGLRKHACRIEHSRRRMWPSL